MVRLFLFFLFMSAWQGAEAKKSEEKKYKPVSTYESFNRGRTEKKAHIYLLQSELALRANDYTRAVKLGKQAVESDPENMQARVALGEALSAYLKELDETNADYIPTKNEAIKTWLVVLRNLVGSERGLNIKGVGSPFFNKFFEDENRVVKAKSRIKELCGRTPKFWETNEKFLQKVITVETGVSGKVVEDKATEKQ